LDVYKIFHSSVAFGKIEYSMFMQKNGEDFQSKHLSITSSERELYKRGLQTTKNFRMLLNRINVLTRERDHRLRGIECKLNQHQEFLAKKVERSNYRQEVCDRIR